ncbi:peptidase M6 [Microbacterium terrisoli]|uniref:peptidase M6 n=1 Tax=Microbacterium terrisoli TaxID=3242192 RepID=UPI002805EB98|nr:peptidase M6 [Microbacterium protaetiae]
MASSPTDRIPRSRRRRVATALVVAATASSMMLLGNGVAQAANDRGIDPGVLDPVDPQNWVNMDDMTWDDYTAVPGTDWASKTEGSKRHFNGAIVLVDFENQDFVISKKEASDVFGTPSGLANSVPREDVPEFYRDLLNTPSELNHGRTINEYWMEQTGGRLSVDLEAFGPYRLPGNIEEYGLNDSFNKTNGSNANVCPQGETCNKNIRTDALAAWSAATGIADPLGEFDEVFWVTAGHDESSTWEEFGQQIFASKEDVTDPFGPPRDENGLALDQNGNNMPNWSKTRYVEWTSWAAATNHWPNANFPVVDRDGNVTRAGNSTQAESSGMGTFAHEFSHILGISDNYGNPYGADAADGGPLRDTSGPFDVLARGSFNGPGGTHTRWGVPSVAGGSQPAGVALRNRLNLGMIDSSSVIDLTRSELEALGSITTDLQSRALQEDGVPLGINLKLDGGDLSSGTCTRKAQWDCDGGGFNNYTLEVIDRMGTDSFQPDSGVMISKTKNADRNPFIWTIDANPQDIDTLDYVRADGTPVPITRGDQRQLNDALFHAGNDSGSEYEYVDELNRLQFYVVNRSHDDRGILHYQVAVRSLDSAGPQARGVQLGKAEWSGKMGEGLRALTVPVTNTGAAVDDARANSDIYRVTTSISGAKGAWEVQTPSSIVTAKAGQTIQVPVYVHRTGTSSNASGTVTVTITSENDPSATQTISYKMNAANG